jgi:hypothetical protein
VRENLKRLWIYRAAVAVIVANLLVPLNAAAAGQLTSRKLTLGSSASNTSTTWAFTFSVTETTALNGLTFQVCSTASGACSAPGSWTNAGSAFDSLTYNGSAQTGWALDNAAGYLRIKNNASTQSVSSPVVATFNTVTNPTLANGTTFFVRVLTYSGDDYTSQVDNGVVTAAIVNQITVTANVDETLSFCVYTGANCGEGGATVALGSLTASLTGSGTSKMDVATNGSGGYNVTYTGTTLTGPGATTIAAMGTQSQNGAAATSSQGTSQFGLNLRDNATPNVGADVSGSGTGAYGTNYGTADSFRHFTGDSIATASAPTDSNTFTVSYIANISGSQAAGSYTTTLTYICTATY